MRLLTRALCVSFLFIAPVAQADEELDKIFKKVNEYIAAKNYPKAIEELGWAENEITKMHNQELKTYLPDELAGFKGDDIKISQALGMSNVERNYKSGNASVKVSLMGGSKGSAMGGLANIGRMAAMMGGQNGQESMRIDGKTATLNSQGSNTELSVFLDSGGILKFETRKSNDAAKEQLKKMAEEMKLSALDKYLAGSAS